MDLGNLWSLPKDEITSSTSSGAVVTVGEWIGVEMWWEFHKNWRHRFFLAFQRFYSDLSWFQFPLFSEPDQTGRHLKPQSHPVELDWVDNWCLEKNIRNNFTWRWVFLYMSFYMCLAKVMKESFTFYQNPQSKHWFDVVYQNRPFDVVCTFWSEPYFEENL